MLLSPPLLARFFLLFRAQRACPSLTSGTPVWVNFLTTPLGLLLLLLLASPANPLSLEPRRCWGSDFHSPRTAALGGAGRAGPLLGDAIYLNPSYQPFIKTHSLSVNYLNFQGLNQEQTAGRRYYGNNLNLSVLDGTQETLFQAGLGYTRRNDANLVHLAVAKSFFTQFGIGLGMKFVFPNPLYQGALGSAGPNPQTSNFNDLNLSTTFFANSWLQAALLLDNLLENGRDFGFYRELSLGTRFYWFSIVAFLVDVHLTPNLPSAQAAQESPWGIEAGVEFTFMKDFFLRGGLFNNSSTPYQARLGNGYGVGVGWLGPKLSFDYSYSSVVGPISSFVHNCGVTLFF